MAQSPYYYSAAKNTETVGRFIGEKLVSEILIGNLTQDPKKIHAIGHSLGAHVSGHIGREVQNQGNAKIGRVTGKNDHKILQCISDTNVYNYQIIRILFSQVWIQRSHIFTKLPRMMKNT